MYYAPIEKLPNLRFFEPTKAFVPLIRKTAAKRLIIDCGAGVGHITKLLQDNGIRACAIDTTERDDPACEVAPLDAMLFPFNQDMIALIARPCGGSWIRGTFEQAISRGADVIYVGVSRNFERDLTGIPYTVTLLRKHVGKERETAYLVTK